MTAKVLPDMTSLGLQLYTAALLERVENVRVGVVILLFPLSGNLMLVFILTPETHERSTMMDVRTFIPLRRRSDFIYF